MDQVLRVVLVHADLLQNDPPLGLYIALVEPGVEHHVAQDVGRPVQVVVQAAGVKAGALLGGVSVDLAADGVHLLGELPGGAPLGALEGHVLDEVGGAPLARLLMAGAGAHPQAQAGRADGGDVLGDDADPVGQGLEVIEFFHSSLAVCRI